MSKAENRKEDSCKIEDYFEIIDRCAENEEDFTIQNSDPIHAAYLLKTLFKRAKSVVCIYTGELYPVVYDNDGLKEEAIKFLRRDSKNKLRIVYQKDVPAEEIFGRSLLKSILSDREKQGTVEVWKKGESVPADINHFAVKDGKAFRFETNAITMRAIANFGNVTSGKTLADVFDKIVLQSIPVPIPT